MIESKIKGYDPSIFKCYQRLACAVLNQYWKDKRREVDKLNKAKDKLEKRIKTGRSRGLIRRWNPDSAMESYMQMERNFERFCYFEKTELYQFCMDIATSRTYAIDVKTNPKGIRGNKLC